MRQSDRSPSRCQAAPTSIRQSIEPDFICAIISIANYSIRTSAKAIFKHPRLGHLHLLRDQLSVLLKKRSRNKTITLNERHGLARHDPNHAGVKALGQVSGDAQQPGIGLPQIELNHQACVAHTFAPASTGTQTSFLFANIWRLLPLCGFTL